MSRRLRRSLQKWSFPVLGWLSAAMYLVMASGLPLPTPQAAMKDRSIPFPCMDSPCGCHSAEQCWKSCCCHTPAERLAWARTHGVTPPRGMVLEVNLENVDSHLATSATNARQKSCCAAKPTCCAATSGGGHESHAENPPRRSQSNSTIGIYALECHGFGTNWLAASIALPPTLVTSEYRAMPTDRVSAPTLQISFPAFPPPVPPPRPAVS